MERMTIWYYQSHSNMWDWWDNTILMEWRKVCYARDWNVEVRRPICVGSILIWFPQKFNQTRFAGSCDGNWVNLLKAINSSLKWRSDEISSGNSFNRLKDKSRYWSEFVDLIWDVCDLIETETQMCEIWEIIQFWWNYFNVEIFQHQHFKIDPILHSQWKFVDLCCSTQSELSQICQMF
jgi:hypothetical protein